MGVFNSKAYNALDEEGRAWTKTVERDNCNSRLKECFLTNDTKRVAWVLTHFGTKSYDFKTGFAEDALRCKAFDCLRLLVDIAGFNITTSGSGDKAMALKMFYTAASERNDDFWRYLESKNKVRFFPEASEMLSQAFKAGWLEKASEALMAGGALDPDLYLEALMNWPETEGKSFSSLLSWRNGLSQNRVQSILDDVLYGSVSRGRKSHAEALIDAGADVNHTRNKRFAACVLRAAKNQDPDMIDLLIAHGAKIDEVGPFFMEEVRAENPYSPIIGHLKKYVKAAELPSPETGKGQGVDGYALADAETLMHRQVLPGTDIVLTTTFNFAKRQQTIVTQAEGNLTAETKNFDEVLGAEAIMILSEKFKACGGVPEVFFVMKKSRSSPPANPGGLR